MEVVVQPDWLEAHLDAPDLRIVDASWYLPAQGRDARSEYAAAHLPGAVHIDLATDLADPSAPVRNTLAAPEVLARAFGARGIGRGQRVVVYDRLAGFSAGRVWWALRYLGHERVALLDGGFERWVAEGRPVTAEIPTPIPVGFEPRAEARWLRGLGDVREIVANGGVQLVDAREAERFAGTGVEPTRHKGHMPGARSLPYSEQLAGDPPRLRPREQLRALYRDAGIDLARPIVTTCGSGVTAALNALVLTWLGAPDVAVYDGSWAEWGDRDDTPIVGPGRT